MARPAPLERVPDQPVTGLLGLAGRRDSLLPDSGLERIVRNHLEFELLQDAPIPLHVTATDVLSGEAVRLSRGDALDAILASAAIPGVLPRWSGTTTTSSTVVSPTTPR